MESGSSGRAILRDTNARKNYWQLHKLPRQGAAASDLQDRKQAVLLCLAPDVPSPWSEMALSRNAKMSSVMNNLALQGYKLGVLV